MCWMTLDGSFDGEFFGILCIIGLPLRRTQGLSESERPCCCRLQHMYGIAEGFMLNCCNGHVLRWLTDAGIKKMCHLDETYF